MGSGEHSVGKDNVSLVCLDRSQKWLGAYPDKTKEATSVVKAFQQFFGEAKPKEVYSDNSKEILT